MFSIRLHGMRRKYASDLGATKKRSRAMMLSARLGTLAHCRCPGLSLLSSGLLLLIYFRFAKKIAAVLAASLIDLGCAKQNYGRGKQNSSQHNDN